MPSRVGASDYIHVFILIEYCFGLGGPIVHTRPGERLRPDRRHASVAARQRLLQPPAPLAQMAVREPEQVQLPRQPQRELGSSALPQPSQRRAQVGVLLLQQRQP